MASDGREIARRPRAVSSPWRAAILLAFPGAVALLLSAPGLRFPFLFDDFELLARAQAPGWATLRTDHAYPQVRAAAQDLMSLRPGDGEAQAALEEAARGRPADLLIAPVP